MPLEGKQKGTVLRDRYWVFYSSPKKNGGKNGGTVFGGKQFSRGRYSGLLHVYCIRHGTGKFILSMLVTFHFIAKNKALSIHIAVVYK